MLRKLSLFIVLLLTTAWLAHVNLYENQALAADKIPLTVATVCMKAETDKQTNLQRFFSYLEEASAEGAHLIVFPEIALQHCPAWANSSHTPTQQELDYLHNSAETISGYSTEKLVDKASKLNIYMIFGMTEKFPDNDTLYGSGVFLGPNGVIGKYRKKNLWGAGAGGNEHLYFKPGTKKTGVFDSPIGKVGLIVCIDLHYHLGATLAKEGAELLVTMVAWRSDDSGLYEQDTKHQAKLWHVVSDQVGWMGHYTAYGHSRIVDLNGNIVADTGAKEGMAVAETDLLIDASIVGVSPLQSTATMWGKIKNIN